MTENERLRELLNKTVKTILDEGQVGFLMSDLPNEIDAVLAEPTTTDQDSFTLGANKMRTEIFWMLSSRYGRFGISETLQCAMEVRAMQLPKDGE